MAWEAEEYADLLSDTVVISTGTSRDKYGAVTYGSGTTYAARVVMSHDHNQINSGLVLEARTIVYMSSTSLLPSDIKVTLPDGTTPPILTVDQYPDEDGAVHHQRIRLGAQQ